MKTRQRFGALLSAFRARANLTCERVAFLVLGNAKSRSLVSKWEAGDMRAGKRIRSYPPVARFPKLLAALDLSHDDARELLAAYAEETGAMPCHGLTRSSCRRLANRTLVSRKRKTPKT